MFFHAVTRRSLRGPTRSQHHQRPRGDDPSCESALGDPIRPNNGRSFGARPCYRDLDVRRPHSKRCNVESTFGQILRRRPVCDKEMLILGPMWLKHGQHCSV